MSGLVLGLFRDPDSALGAVRSLRANGHDDLELITPVPIHGADEIVGTKKSAIRRFTFFGGIFGALSGFALAAGTAVLYLHPTGGRPIITIPPFLIITYEMTILCGILATVLGFFISSRFPVLRERSYAPEAAVDRFVVSVSCDDEAALQSVMSELQNAGADEVRRGEEG
ncbi:MAG: DUF3341 domain-containing protein [Woeseiaceae bacterium]